MADLRDILPHFDLQPWRHLTYSLEKKDVSTAELISQDPVEIARRCPLPLKEVKRLIVAVNAALQVDLAFTNDVPRSMPEDETSEPPKKRLRREQVHVNKEMTFVRTLDATIDQCLGGGFPTGSISEIVGESAVGKTQFVLSLLLSAQLPTPKGLGRPVLYLSTEDKLNTSRLCQMLENNPEYQDLPEPERPNLDRIFTISTHNFDHQENITLYKLPFLVEQNKIGLIVIDSVTANFRVQFPGATPAVLSRRAVALVKLGNVLQKLAHEYDVAVVITNQVADRFDDARIDPDKFRLPSSTPTSSAPTAPSTQPANPPNTQPKPTQTSMGPPASKSTLMTRAEKDEVMRLDYQQCFFTGWGDDPAKPFEGLKTPALGLTWANQINARIVLKIAHDVKPTMTENIYSDQKRRRHLSVVFAPWAPPTITPVEYELCMQGPVSVPLANGKTHVLPQGFDDDDNDAESEAVQDESEDIHEMLDPKYWEDDLVVNEEFS